MTLAQRQKSLFWWTKKKKKKVFFHFHVVRESLALSFFLPRPPVRAVYFAFLLFCEARTIRSVKCCWVFCCASILGSTEAVRKPMIFGLFKQTSYWNRYLIRFEEIHRQIESQAAVNKRNPTKVVALCYFATVNLFFDLFSTLLQISCPARINPRSAQRLPC